MAGGAAIILLIGIFMLFMHFAKSANATTTPDCPLGKLLTSGNGKGNRIIVTKWVWGIIHTSGAFVCFIIFVPAILDKITPPPVIRGPDGRSIAVSDADPMTRAAYYALVGTPSDKKNKMFWIGGGLAFFFLTTVWVQTRACANSEIAVHENGVTGKSATFPYDFRLTYDKITNVETHDRGDTWVIIHASGERYKCYVLNPAEIKKVINEQRKVANQTTG